MVGHCRPAAGAVLTPTQCHPSCCQPSTSALMTSRMLRLIHHWFAISASEEEMLKTLTLIRGTFTVVKIQTLSFRVKTHLLSACSICGSQRLNLAGSRSANVCSSITGQSSATASSNSADSVQFTRLFRVLLPNRPAAIITKTSARATIPLRCCTKKAGVPLWWCT